MTLTRNSLWLVFGLPLVCVTVTAVVRYLLNPVLGHHSPLLLFTLPVVVSALYGGLASALLATLLGGVVGTYLFVAGLGWSGMDTTNLVRIALFVLIGLTVSVVGGRLHASKRAASHNARLLADANRRKDEFLAMLGHELRNPLAGIKSASDVLRSGQASEPSQFHATVDIISRQAAHMSRLVDDLLDASRIARGQIRIDKHAVYLQQVVREAAEQVQILMAARQHRLTLDLPAEDAWVLGDHTRLLQVVANLLTNAAKYSPPRSEVAVSLSRHDQEYWLEVIDHGAGLAPDLIPHIFDTFVQGERGADRVEGGLGLGLALVKSVVALHDGKVEVISAGPGQGSTFRVRLAVLQGVPNRRPVVAVDTELPAAPVAPLPAPPLTVDAAARPQNCGLHILVVDDNADAARMLGQLLESYGHQVALAFDGEQAMQMARQASYDACVLDIGLPGMNGWELAQALRALPHLAGSTLIALTGYGLESDRHRTRAAGIDHHMVKPANMDVLMQLLGAVPPMRHAA